MMRLAALAAFAILGASCGGTSPGPPQGQKITPEEAAASARAHLPWFLERLAAADPADGNFRLTVWMPAEGGRKSPQLVMRDVAADGQSLSGIVSKADPAWPEYPEGNTFFFGPSVVADWTFTHDGRMIGAFWLRAQMCELGKVLKGVRGRTPEADAAVLELREKFDPANACKPYDPRQDYEGRGAPRAAQ